MRQKFTVSAPIVAIASVEVWAEDAEEAREIGEDVLRDGDTNASIHVHHDYDIDSEEVTAALTDEDAQARELAIHVAVGHFGMDADAVDQAALTASLDKWQAMHVGLHDGTPCTHTHEEMA